MSHVRTPTTSTTTYKGAARDGAGEPPSDPYAHVKVKGCRVLVVEDERAVRELIVRCLRAIEITDVTDVSTAGAAWNSLVGENAKAFHIMLTDLSLPDASGQVLIKMLRELPSKRAKTLPVIVLSADSTIESYQRLMRYDISSYLIKPVSPALLRSAIGRALAAPGERAAAPQA